MSLKNGGALQSKACLSFMKQSVRRNLSKGADAERCYYLGISHLPMKSLLVISALILSSSPAVADDFLYVSCEMNGTHKKTAIPSGDLISEVPLVNETLSFKVDLTNNKMRNHLNTIWSDIRIEGNQIVQDEEDNGKGYTGQIRGVMPLNPPGPATVHNWLKSKSEHEVIKAEGECREINSTVFEEVSKQ